MTGQAHDPGPLSRLNYPGLVAGIALVILPFLDAWWRFSLGTLVVLSLSPFQVLVESLGKEITSPLLSSLNLALKIITIYYGVILVAGSVLRTQEGRRSLSDMLVKESARKFLWLVVLFVLSVAIADFAIGQALASMGVTASVPFFVGGTSAVFRAGTVAVTLPIQQGFTLMFGVAVVVALIALAAYSYQDRRTPQAGQAEQGKQAPTGGEKASGGAENQGR